MGLCMNQNLSHANHEYMWSNFAFREKKISEKKPNKKSLLLHSVENSYYKFDLETENKIAHFSVLCFP